jgi:hypothetical protein
MPGWRADTLDKFFQKDVKLYPEQALLMDTATGRFEPFGHVNPNLSLFQEPSPTFPDPNDPKKTKEQWLQEWLDFKSWSLGAPLNTTKPTAFDTFLAEIAERVRRYNAAMYWMRRLHFHENDVPIKDPPKWNKHGDKLEKLDNLTASDFQTLVTNAEQEWNDAVDSLNLLLAGNDPLPSSDSHSDQGFKFTSADMVEVNGYIVSMRIVSSQPQTTSDYHTTQVGGSSSSHISISSAFSNGG